MFIIDQNNHLIAADTKDLAQWGFKDILDAVKAFREGKVRFEKEVAILLLPDDTTVDCTIETLDSLMGTWYLCHTAETTLGESLPDKALTSATETHEEDFFQLLPESEEERPAEAGKEPAEITEEQSLKEAAEEELEDLLKLLPEEEESFSENPEEEGAPLSLMNVEESSPTSETTPESVQQKEEVEEEILLPETSMEADEAPLQISLEESTEIPVTEEESLPSLQLEEVTASEASTEEAVPQKPEEESFAIETVEEPPSETVTAEPERGPKAWEEIEGAFEPDLSTSAANLNLGMEEYRSLVKDFIQDCRRIRTTLLESDATERHEAISILTDAVALLQLKSLGDILDMIESAAPSERREIVDTLERMLERLESFTDEATPTVSDKAVSEEALPTEAETSQRPSEKPVAEEKTTPVEEESTPSETETKAEPESQTTSVEAFLEGVQPIPINFSIHIAAEELNLPDDLVQEFISDFANQGHEYLPVLIEAYQAKDLDKLQKTAHMLKGAASNLRVEAMVENLYELQYDNDIERAPERIRKFYGQLISLDKFLKQLNS